RLAPPARTGERSGARRPQRRSERLHLAPVPAPPVAHRLGAVDEHRHDALDGWLAAGQPRRGHGSAPAHPRQTGREVTNGEARVRDHAVVHGDGAGHADLRDGLRAAGADLSIEVAGRRLQSAGRENYPRDDLAGAQVHLLVATMEAEIWDAARA